MILFQSLLFIQGKLIVTTVVIGVDIFQRALLSIRLFSRPISLAIAI